MWSAGLGARVRACACAVLERAAATLIGNGQITRELGDGAELLFKEWS
jgi:hypothetical protein